MKNKLFYLPILFLLIFLSGCFMSDYNYVKTPKYSAPPGAYYIKPGMTREERLRDVEACGSRSRLSLDFTKEDMEKASKATDEFIPGKNNDGYFILLRRLHKCMVSKGYHVLSNVRCEGDDPKVMEPCMYP
jgi:hypothetical protein